MYPEIFALFFLFPALLGGVIRTVVRKHRRPWLFTLAAAILACGVWLWAWSLPIPGYEGPGIRAIQTSSLAVGMLLTGIVFRLRR